MMPALFSFTPEASGFRTEAVSVGVAIILIAVYALSLLFSFKTHKALFRGATHTEEPKWSLRRAIGVWPGQPCWWP